MAGSFFRYLAMSLRNSRSACCRAVDLYQAPCLAHELCMLKTQRKISHKLLVAALLHQSSTHAAVRCGEAHEAVAGLEEAMKQRCCVMWTPAYREARPEL